MGQKIITDFVSHVVSARVNAITHIRALDHPESQIRITFGLEEQMLECILE